MNLYSSFRDAKTSSRSDDPSKEGALAKHGGFWLTELAAASIAGGFVLQQTPDLASDGFSHRYNV